MMTTTTTATETFSLYIGGDEPVSFSLSPSAARAGVRVWELTASHPEGGSVTFEVVEFRGFHIGGEIGAAEAPSDVIDSMRGIVRRMDAAWANARSSGSDKVYGRWAFGRAMGR